MGKEKLSSEESNQSKDPENFLKNSKSNKNKSIPMESKDSDGREVLIKVGGFEYKTPTKSTRVFLGTLVIALNLILVLAVVLYFYNPSFQEFIYNVGRD